MNDIEEQKLMQRHEVLSSFLNSPGWNEARARLLKKIATFSSVDSIDVKADIIPTILAARLVKALVIDWMDQMYKDMDMIASNMEVYKQVEEDAVMTDYGLDPTPGGR